MAVSTRFVLQQGGVLRGLGQTAVGALKQRLGQGAAPPSSIPGNKITATFAPRPPALIRAYVRNVGGDPSAYKHHVPAHLFPQWAFALTGKTLEGLDYPMLSAMNGGCELIEHARLPQGEALEVSARLESIDDNGRRAILTQRVVTGTRSAPGALVAKMQVFVPLPKKPDAGPRAPKKPPARVPESAREVAWLRVKSDAGLDFAKLTGDFNPIHWVPAYARAFGFRSTILHGFGTMARAIEGVNRGLYAGDVTRLKHVRVRFTKPLVLPAQVGVFLDGEHLTVGPAPGGPAYLTGTCTETLP
ncbi:MAG: MaoC/PaaZ C-terminal domain-containing protein [Sandaracinaceae bacterium]